MRKSVHGDRAARDGESGLKWSACWIELWVFLGRGEKRELSRDAAEEAAMVASE